jgi:hypothetical protein
VHDHLLSGRNAGETRKQLFHYAHRPLGFGAVLATHQPIPKPYAPSWHQLGQRRQCRRVPKKFAAAQSIGNARVQLRAGLPQPCFLNTLTIGRQRGD